MAKAVWTTVFFFAFALSLSVLCGCDGPIQPEAKHVSLVEVLPLTSASVVSPLVVVGAGTALDAVGSDGGTHVRSQSPGGVLSVTATLPTANPSVPITAFYVDVDLRNAQASNPMDYHRPELTFVVDGIGYVAREEHRIGQNEATVADETIRYTYDVSPQLPGQVSSIAFTLTSAGVPLWSGPQIFEIDQVTISAYYGGAVKAEFAKRVRELLAADPILSSYTGVNFALILDGELQRQDIKSMSGDVLIVVHSVERDTEEAGPRDRHNLSAQVDCYVRNRKSLDADNQEIGVVGDGTALVPGVLEVSDQIALVLQNNTLDNGDGNGAYVLPANTEDDQRIDDADLESDIFGYQVTVAAVKYDKCY